MCNCAVYSSIGRENRDCDYILCTEVLGGKIQSVREMGFIISDEEQTQNYKETSKTALAQKFTPEKVQT